MSEYYAVQRSDDSLSHYGVRGMKWGVRKAVRSGNAKKLSKQYNKAAKKLAKLEKRANSGSKYKARAAALGAGAALAGTTAAFGPSKVAKYATRGAGHAVTGFGKAVNRAGELISKNPKTKAKGLHIKAAGLRMQSAGAKMRIAGTNAGKAIDQWGKSRSISKGASTALNDIGSKIQTRSLKYGANVRKAASKAGVTSWNAGRAVNKANLSNNAIARIGAAAIGTGLAGAAGYNAYRAATTKKAAKKAAAFRSEMRRTFAGTKYASLPSTTKSNRQGKKRSKRS